MLDNRSQDACKLALKVLAPRFNYSSRLHDPDYELVQRMLPIAGLLIGVAMWAGATLIHHMTSQVLGAIIGAIAATVFLWWVREGHNTRGMLWLVSVWPRREESQLMDAYSRFSTMQLAVLIKTLCIGVLLFLDHREWLVVMVVLAACSLGEVYSPALILGKRRHQHVGPAGSGMWLAGGFIILVISGLFHGFAPGLFAIIIVWLGTPAVENWLSRMINNDLPEPGKRAVTEIMEHIALLVGVIYFLGIHKV